MTKVNREDVSLCQSCYCMTKTIDRKCGKCKADKTQTSDLRELVKLQVDNAWSRGANWACKGRGYAMDTDAEREAETIIELFNNKLSQTRNDLLREIMEALPKKRVVDISDSRTIWQDEAFNLAIDQATQNINNLDKE